MTIKPGDFQALKEKREETIREDRKEVKYLEYICADKQINNIILNELNDFQVQVTFNHDSTFCIQGLIFTIMFGFMIIFFGLEKNPRVLEYW